MIAKGFEPLMNTYDFWRVAQMLYHYRKMPGLGSPFRSTVDMIAYVRGPKHPHPPIGADTHNLLSEYWYYGKHPNHPSEKSVSIAEQLIGYCVHSDASAVVLDPFMGSGTTLVAAKLLGLRAIGIEQEETYVETAIKRLAQEVMLFDGGE